METPLHGATAMQEMLLQSHGGKLAIFPAVPTRWPDVKMMRFRGEGGYLVSGLMEDGKCRWALLESTVGGNVDVVLPPGTYKWSKNGAPASVQDVSGALPLQTVKGDHLLIWLAE